MNEIYLYKLTSGETVIGEFLRAETINERTGETAHMVKFPMRVPSGHYDEMHEWFTGCTDDIVPISLKYIMLIASGDALDSVLVECYDQLINGPDPEDEVAKEPLMYHQV